MPSVQLGCQDQASPLPRLVAPPSAVSQALRAMDCESSSSVVCSAGKESAEAGGVRIRVAGSLSARARAYGLAYELYRGKGYVAERSRRLIVSDYDARPQTLTLLAEERNGLACGTATLVFDGREGLPCDELYGREMRSLRSDGRRLCEVTRLAVRGSGQRSAGLVARLFNHIYLHARRTMKCDDFVIEVHPRHAGFYGRILGFEQLGPTLGCRRVGGAPAALMRLDLALVEQAIAALRSAGRRAAAGLEQRMFYRRAMGPELERQVVRRLAREQRGMDDAQRRYFGLAPRSAEASPE